MRNQIISPEQTLTFSDYFKLRASTEDILAYFGYTKVTEIFALPRSSEEIESFQSLRERLGEHIIHISLENELTRREFLIAPIMSEVRHLTSAKLRSEYWLEFNHQLKGSLDYFLQREKNLLVVEAKRADLTRGFTQLAVEMIALDKILDADQNVIYGAVSTGREWQFGKLNRQTKVISQDAELYVLLANLKDIMQILIGILESRI